MSCKGQNQVYCRLTGTVIHLATLNPYAVDGTIKTVYFRGIQPEDKSNVKLMGFHSTNRCLVRSLNSSDVKYYEKVLASVNEYGKKASPITTKLDIGAFTLAEKNGLWLRARVLDNNRNYKLQLLDVGRVEFRRQEELREILRGDDNIHRLPLYLSLVELDKVSYISGRDKPKSNLSAYEDREYRIEFVNENAHVPIVNLFDSLDGKLLNEEIAKKVQAAN